MSRLEELIAAMPKIDHGPIDKAAYARAYRDLVQYLRSSVKTPGPDSETYYTKGKDGAYWEGLPDAPAPLLPSSRRSSGPCPARPRNTTRPALLLTPRRSLLKSKSSNPTSARSHEA